MWHTITSQINEMVTKTYNRYLTKQKEDVMALAVQIRRKWEECRGVSVTFVCVVKPPKNTLRSSLGKQAICKMLSCFNLYFSLTP